MRRSKHLFTQANCSSETTMAPNKVVKADQSLIDQLCGIASK